MSNLRHAFPEALGAAVAAVAARLPAADFEPSKDSIGPVVVAGEPLAIPRRIYNRPMEPPAALDGTMELVWRCLYSRHDDGFVRQRQVLALLDARENEWVAPFLVQLLGEYVIEIVEEIAAVDILDAQAVREFAGANPDFIRLTRQRAASYWDCYHRGRWPRLRDYPATRILGYLGN